MQGKVIIYTGNGEGKTSAAIGHAIRFSGYGKRAAILHFMKGRKTGEFKFLEKNKLIDTYLFGPPFFLVTAQATLGGWMKGDKIEYISLSSFTGKKNNNHKKVVADKLADSLKSCSFEAHQKKAKKGMEFANKIMKEKKHKLVVLDEILYAIKFKLVKEDDVISLIEKRKNVHMILTGRFAPERIVQMADLVSYLEEGKHYFYDDRKAHPSLDY